MITTLTNISFYLALGIGLISIGDITLIPGVYIGYLGNFSLAWIFVFSIAVAALSDSFWYGVGYYLPTERLMKYRIIRREKERAQILQDLYRKHTTRMTFLSKFMYGTQIFFQVTAGAHRVSFFTYLGASLLATVVWFLVATLLGITIGWSFGDVENVVIGIEATLSVTLLVGIISYLSLRWISRKTPRNTRRKGGRMRFLFSRIL